MSEVLGAEDLLETARLLGRFTTPLIGTIVSHLATDWMDYNQTCALMSLARTPAPTTRELGESNNLNRRAVNRLVSRLARDHIVTTEPDHEDGRAVRVALTAEGRSRFDNFEQSAEVVLDQSTEVAAQLVALLDCGVDHRFEPQPGPLALTQQYIAVGAAQVRIHQSKPVLAAMTSRQRIALLRIATDGPTRPNDLAPKLGVNASAVTYLVDQLTAKKLLLRDDDSDDRRVVMLKLTPDGNQAVIAILDALQATRPHLCRIFTHIRDRRITSPHAPTAGTSERR